MQDEAVSIQRNYYARTAEQYDAMHVSEHDEHNFALNLMIAVIKQFSFASVLDIGSGTGRALLRIKSELPSIQVVGVEPSEELRNVGHKKGLSALELVDGDALSLSYADNSFDVVCEFGALHHIQKPSAAVAEMLRVSRHAVFISDCNNFGQGGKGSRLIKRALNAIGAWPLANWLKTGGKGYTISDGDGLAYSYSVFNDFEQVARKCRSVHMLNTVSAGPNFYISAPQVALLGIK